MIPRLQPKLEAHLEAQERFEEIRARYALRAGTRLSDLAYANFWDRPPEGVIDALKKTLDVDHRLHLQYTPYGGVTVARRVVAKGLAETHDDAFTWRHVVLTPGAMAALAVLFRALCRPGDEVAVIVPCWLDYPLYLEELGVRPVFVPVMPRTHRLDLEALSGAISDRTRAVVLSQPANPTGVVHRPNELAALATLLAEKEERFGKPIALISDECHRDVVFPPTTFTSPLQHHPFTFVVYSLGKRLGMQGQRIGYVAVPPRVSDADEIVRTLSRLCRAMGISTPTALMQLALHDLLEVKPDLSSTVDRRARMLWALEQAGYEVQPSEGTFFLYPATPGDDDFAFTEALASRGVLVIPAPVFHHHGHFRVSLTASDEMIDRALAVLSEARHLGRSR